MIAIPALDLRDGACVQLVGGSFDDERVRLPNPLAVLNRWIDAGFSRLHLIDLDAAAGLGANDDVVDQIVCASTLSVAVGGGVRSEDRAAQLISAGAEWVIVGTRGVEELPWLASLADRFPNRVILAADVRDRSVVVRGWTQRLDIGVLELVSRLRGVPLAGLLVTAVHREGRLEGPDLDLVGDVVGSTHLPVIASGGIASVDDLRALEARGAAACVIGMALYRGAVDPRAIATEFSE